MPKVKKAASFGHGQFKNGGGGKRPYGLGYSPAEANKAVSAVYREDMDIETIIKMLLKDWQDLK